MRSLTAVACVVALAACGGANDEPPAEPAGGPAIDPRADELERAKAVEEELRRNKDALDRTIEEAEKPARE